MRYSWQVFLIVAFLITASCRSAKNLPKTSARIEADSIKLAQQAELIKDLIARRTPGDTLTFYLNMVTQTDCPELLTENQKLHKKQNFWKKVAAVFFLMATGHYIYTATN